MRHRITGKRIIICMLIGALATGLCSCSDSGKSISFDGTGEQFSTEVKAKAGGERYEIAVLDIEPGESSSLFLYGYLEELKKMGWITYERLPFGRSDTPIEQMMSLLANEDLGPYVSFSEDDLYLMTDDNGQALSTSLKERAEEGRLDLVLAMGTTPGLFMKALDIDVPFLVTMATDPIASGIIESVEYSGDPDIWALVEPNPMGRQMEYYIDLFDIHKLGMVTVDEYEEIAAVPDYEKTLKEENIELLKTVLPEGKRDEAFFEMTKASIYDMAQNGIDAYLVTYGLIDDAAWCRELFEPLIEKDIPILVSDGEYLVEAGGLLCVSSYDYEGYGRFCATVSTSIFNGMEAGGLPCEYVSAPNIVFNMDTAKAIGFNTSFRFLLSCDKIFSGKGEL